MDKKLTAKAFFFALFVALVLVGKQLNFSQVIGAENQFFTFYQFFGPVSGGFLGPVFGAAAVFFAELLHYIATGKGFDVVTVWRLFPMVFAAVYFSRKLRKPSLLVPLVAIVAFNLHPVGREAWFFSLYWLIPVICHYFFRNRLFFRSLGATFTAHAVGGALWVWTVPMTAAQWAALVPVVAFERVLFAAGIALSYIAFNSVLHKVENAIPNGSISLEPRYALPSVVSRLFARH